MIGQIRLRCLFAVGVLFVCAGAAQAQTSVTLQDVTGGELSFEISGTYSLEPGQLLGAIHIDYRIKGTWADWSDGGTVENPGQPNQTFEETVEVATSETYEVRLRMSTGTGTYYSEVMDVDVQGVGGGGP